MTAFWDIVSCRLVEIDVLEARSVSIKTVIPEGCQLQVLPRQVTSGMLAELDQRLRSASAVMMGAVSTSETSANFCETTRCNILQYTRRRDSLNSTIPE
jgi:hypothetical protein